MRSGRARAYKAQSGSAILGVYIFSRCADIPVEELFNLSLILCDKDGLSVGIEPWATRPPCHLVIFAGRDRLHPFAGRKPKVVPYNYSSGR